MIEALEAENEALAARGPTSAIAATSSDQPAAGTSSSAICWQRKYEEAKARADRLELEVERIVLRGGHNPLDTKAVL